MEKVDDDIVLQEIIDYIKNGFNDDDDKLTIIEQKYISLHYLPSKGKNKRDSIYKLLEVIKNKIKESEFVRMAKKKTESDMVRYLMTPDESEVEGLTVTMKGRIKYSTRNKKKNTRKKNTRQKKTKKKKTRRKKKSK